MTVRHALAWMLLSSPTLASAEGVPEPVSPGSAAAALLTEARCPTFSWAGARGARGYELAVFRLAGEDGEAVLFTRATLPGDARA